MERDAGGVKESGMRQIGLSNRAFLLAFLGVFCDLILNWIYLFRVISYQSPNIKLEHTLSSFWTCIEIRALRVVPLFEPSHFYGIDSSASTLTKWPANATKINVGACRKKFVSDLTDVFSDLRLSLRDLGQGLLARKTVRIPQKNGNFPEHAVRPRVKWGHVPADFFLHRWNRSSSQTWTSKLNLSAFELSSFWGCSWSSGKH